MWNSDNQKGEKLPVKDNQLLGTNNFVYKDWIGHQITRYLNFQKTLTLLKLQE